MAKHDESGCESAFGRLENGDKLSDNGGRFVLQLL